MKNITILGSTGSIGSTTLDVIRRHRADFNIVGLSCNSNYKLLAKQANEFKPLIVCIGSSELIKPIEMLLDYKPEIVCGQKGLVAIVKNADCDLLFNALVGAAGLVPTVEALNLSIDIAIANKETLVIGGSIITSLAKENGANLIPVDSEHNAIHQCIRGNEDRKLIGVVLTASGGPLLNYPIEGMSKVTPEEALNHPTWGMGKKISIDSATMVNKGLEIIEAKWLFDLSVDMIDVVIHPQSIVHGMVEFSDGSCLAMMGPTSMSVPIIYALYYPGFAPESCAGSLKGCRNLNLEFTEPDLKRFPALNIAREVARVSGTAPCVFNAANEIAVEAFLERVIKFPQITEVINRVLDRHEVVFDINLDVLIETDSWAREIASDICKTMRKV